MFEEQMNLLHDSRLLDNAEKVFVHINGDVIPSFSHPNIEYVINPRLDWEETDTMCAIKNFAATNEDYKILYFHMKGIKSQISPAWPANPNGGKEYVTNWRRMMESYVVRKWELCVKLLDNYDSVGCNYAAAPRPHWSGGMWWATSDYIKTLDNALLETESRWDREFWIGSGDLYMAQRRYGVDKIFPNTSDVPPGFAELHRSNVDHYNVNYPPELWGEVPEEFKVFDE